ncbi:MAG: aromatic amino acid lyase, partial [Deltaproteobacteria bacterium]
MKEIFLGVDGMVLADLIAIARRGAKVRLTEESKERIRSSRQLIDKWVVEERVIYGITTGFGALSDKTISKKDTRVLQENILMSHAAGVGEILDEESVRAVMALLIKDLARGHSGIRLKTVQLLIDLLNHGVCP